MYDLNNNAERVKFLREASDVQRLHAIRTIGEYSNGQHTFNMLSMLRLLWPDAPVAIIWAIHAHDIPERIVGDVPSPALRHIYYKSEDDLFEEESEILGEVFGHTNTIHLSDEDYQWLRGLDILELYLYTKDQFQLGNRNLEIMRIAIENRFKRDAANIPEPILNLFYECKNSDWVHLPDLGC